VAYIFKATLYNTTNRFQRMTWFPIRFFSSSVSAFRRC